MTSPAVGRKPSALDGSSTYDGESFDAGRDNKNKYGWWQQPHSGIHVRHDHNQPTGSPSMPAAEAVEAMRSGLHKWFAASSSSTAPRCASRRRASMVVVAVTIASVVTDVVRTMQQHLSSMAMTVT
jgi:hypothetical protein